ncbi:hypothetical protein Hanom_Chr11g01003261 [Helianthus anomalus]
MHLFGMFFDVYQLYMGRITVYGPYIWMFFKYHVFSRKNTIIPGFLNSSSPLNNIDRNTPLKSEHK